MLNLWTWADVSGRCRLAGSVELTHIAAPLTVVADTGPGAWLTQTETGAAVTCHDVTPIHRHCQQQQQSQRTQYSLITATRRRVTLFTYYNCTARGARNVKFKASQLWNTLPEVLKSVQKLSTFKKCLKHKHYLLSDSVLVGTHCI